MKTLSISEETDLAGTVAAKVLDWFVLSLVVAILALCSFSIIHDLGVTQVTKAAPSTQSTPLTLEDHCQRLESAMESAHGFMAKAASDLSQAKSISPVSSVENLSDQIRHLQDADTDMLSVDHSTTSVRYEIDDIQTELKDGQDQPFVYSSIDAEARARKLERMAEHELKDIDTASDRLNSEIHFLSRMPLPDLSAAQDTDTNSADTNSSDTNSADANSADTSSSDASVSSVATAQESSQPAPYYSQSPVNELMDDLYDFWSQPAPYYSQSPVGQDSCRTISMKKPGWHKPSWGFPENEAPQNWATYNHFGPWVWTGNGGGYRVNTSWVVPSAYTRQTPSLRNPPYGHGHRVTQPHTPVHH